MEKSITDIQTQENHSSEETAKDNMVFIVNGKIAVEATEDKIVVQLDPFKTGYECKKCGGSGKEPKICNICQGEGKNRFGEVCKTCEGDQSKFLGQDCRECRGIGSLIVIPESAKTLPTSGRIVSTGPACVSRKIGERVLFGAHTGYFLPFKGNIKLRILREYEVMCMIHSIDTDIALGDFMVLEEDATFRS